MYCGYAVVCLEVKREYYKNYFVLGCVTQCSQSAAHSGPADWVCHIGTLTPCIFFYLCASSTISIIIIIIEAVARVVLL